jgi:hypothetical protein
LSPTDGQECHYLADAANGVVWHLKYRAASSSAYKWEFVGGSALASRTSGNFAVTSVNPTITVATDGPSVILPLAGDYEAEWNVQGPYNVTNQYWYAFPVVSGAKVMTYTPYYGTAYAGQFGRLVGDGRANGRTAGDTVRIGAYIATAGTFNMQDATLRMTPVRVG